MKINEPVHKMLVLISCVNTCSERSDNLHALTPAQSLQGIRCSHTYSKDVDDDSGKN